jgi:hypothetical protein
MNKFLKNSIICFLLCFIFVSCSKNNDANRSNSAESSENIDTVINKEKKKLFNFTPPEKTLDENRGIKLSELLNLGGDQIGSVNRYLWQSALEVLSFLPITSADPFSGIIVFGKGKAPGSSQIYDATVYVSDPALDARSLSVTVRSKDGTVSLAAKREIENAILSRARQLRLKEIDS